jgi:hypothetical protein
VVVGRAGFEFGDVVEGGSIVVANARVHGDELVLLRIDRRDEDCTRHRERGIKEDMFLFPKKDCETWCV